MPNPTSLEPVTTPIQTFYNPEHEARVDLVGMIHIGQPPYYEAVQTFLDTRDNEGADVHYEMVKRNSPQEIAAAGILVAKKAEQLTSIMDGVYRTIDSVDLGLVKQKDALTYRENWHNIDASEIEIARRLGMLTLLRHVGLIKFIALGMEQLTSEEDKKRKKEVIISALQNASTETEDTDTPEEASVLRKILLGNMNPVIVDYRNTVALRGLDTQTPKKDTVLVWGAGHLKGLGSGLQLRGYKKVLEQKLVAINI